MTPSHSCRRVLGWLFLVLACLAFSGCGKSSTKPKTGGGGTNLTRADADDITQLIATTVASDYGGWYFTIEAMAESLSTPAPALMYRPGGTLRIASPLAAQGTMINYPLTRAGITYQFQAQYFHGDETVTPVRDSASSRLEAVVDVNNGTFNTVVDSTGVFGTYGYHADTTFIVYSLKAVTDTLEFSGIVDDSSFASVNSTINLGSRRLWYHLNFFDYTLFVLKSTATTNPYPLAGSEANWIIEAYWLRSHARDDYIKDIFADAQMSFDGTGNARFVLMDAYSDNPIQYIYRVNLKTGAITALN